MLMWLIVVEVLRFVCGCILLLDELVELLKECLVISEWGFILELLEVFWLLFFFLFVIFDFVLVFEELFDLVLYLMVIMEIKSFKNN